MEAATTSVSKTLVGQHVDVTEVTHCKQIPGRVKIWMNVMQEPLVVTNFASIPQDHSPVVAKLVFLLGLKGVGVKMLTNVSMIMEVVNNCVSTLKEALNVCAIWVIGWNMMAEDAVEWWKSSRHLNMKTVCTKDTVEVGYE